LQAVPGIELVDLKQPGVGLQSVNLAIPPTNGNCKLGELEAAPIISKLVADKKVHIVGRLYRPDSGQVELLASGRAAIFIGSTHSLTAPVRDET
jgi:hypothetical protein